MTVLTYASAAFLIAFVVYVLLVGQSILQPLVIAIFAWHLINAVAKFSGRMQFGGRPLPAVVRLVAAIGVVWLLGWMMTNLVVSNVSQVVARAPEYEQNFRQMANQVSDFFGLEELPALHALFDTGRVSSIVRWITLSLTSLVGSIGVIAVYILFLLVEQRAFDKKMVALFPDPDREARVHGVLRVIGDEIQSYVWLKTIFGLVVTGLSYAVMRTVGIDLAEFWAVVIFSLSYIPYLGAWIGVIFPTLLALVQFDTFTPFLVTAGSLALIQFTCGSVLEPKFMGKGLNLSPLVVMLSLAGLGMLWGLVGMFLAVPALVVAIITLSQFDATRPIAIVMSADGGLRHGPQRRVHQDHSARELAAVMPEPRA